MKACVLVDGVDACIAFLSIIITSLWVAYLILDAWPRNLEMKREKVRRGREREGLQCVAIVRLAR